MIWEEVRHRDNSSFFTDSNSKPRNLSGFEEISSFVERSRNASVLSVSMCYAARGPNLVNFNSVMNQSIRTCKIN